MTLEPILEVCHLSKSFGTHQVLRDVNFTVHPGDVTSILGSSGSGKSTLLRCINLLERPNQGEVRFHGRPITGRGTDASAYRTRVGMVFQSFNLFSNMNVLENSALDPEMVGEVLAVMRALAASGMTMLVVTHEMAFARDVSSQVVFMADGRICESGAPDAFFSSPSQPRTREFLARFMAQ